MKLYNSLTRMTTGFTPLHKDELTIYSCGPTVYERAHIGNLASFIYADTLRRTLQIAYEQAKIKHVMNITDVDDKTIKSSQEAYPDLEPMTALLKMTRGYEEQFKNDLSAVGVDVEAITFVRATDYIPEMQTLIRKLVTAGIGYLADDGIYFSIAQYKASGKTYGQLVEITAESTGAARVNNDEYDKDSIHDFALWKKQKPGEPSWEFEIDGKDVGGRPGWHIECSAMSAAQLGRPFDIHTGGVDLMFPHHENEIAQSTAATNEKYLSKLFFHSEHLLVNGQKMSKSLKNFYTLEDITSRDFDPLAFRLLVLQSHYRSQAHFSWENLTAAKNRLDNLKNWSALRYQKLAPHPEHLSALSLTDMARDIHSGFTDDLDTPKVLAVIAERLPVITYDKQGGFNAQQILESTKFIDECFGLQLEHVADITDSQKALIRERTVARTAQDWGKSDELREQLAQQGIGINDESSGSTWYRLYVGETSTIR
jgi:cysteinyl-tRNA synthetase